MYGLDLPYIESKTFPLTSLSPCKRITDQLSTVHSAILIYMLGEYKSTFKSHECLSSCDGVHLLFEGLAHLQNFQTIH